MEVARGGGCLGMVCRDIASPPRCLASILSPARIQHELFARTWKVRFRVAVAAPVCEPFVKHVAAGQEMFRELWWVNRRPLPLQGWQLLFRGLVVFAVMTDYSCCCICFWAISQRRGECDVCLCIWCWGDGASVSLQQPLSEDFIAINGLSRLQTSTRRR